MTSQGFMRRRADLFLSLFFLVVGMAGAGAEEKGPSIDAPEIAVVQTFGDLIKQPKILLKDGHWVKVGINRASGPLHSWILLYVVADVQCPESFDFSEQVGPLKAEVRIPMLAKEMEKFRSLQQAKQIVIESSLPGGGYLFMKSIPLKTKHKTLLTLKDENEKPLAGVTLTTSPQPYAPWFPLREPEIERLLEKEFDPQITLVAPRWIPSIPMISGDEFIRTGGLLQKADWAHLALPGANGFGVPPRPRKHRSTLSTTQWAAVRETITRLGDEAYDIREQAERSLANLEEVAYEPLCRAKETAADPEVQMRVRRLLRRWQPDFFLEKRASVILGRFRKGIHLNVRYDQFLMRCWVNGKTVVTQVTLEEDFRKMEQEMAFAEYSPIYQVDFPLELDLAALGAKAGDAIGLQLMYCPKGSAYADERQHCHRALKQYMDGGQWPLVSNRIEFVAEEAKE